MLMCEIATPEPDETRLCSKGYSNRIQPAQRQLYAIIFGRVVLITLPRSGTNGSPLFLGNAQICREAVAIPLKCDDNDSGQYIGTVIAPGNIVEVLD